MSRRVSRGAVVTYGRRHQLRQVHTEGNDWGSVFGTEERDKIFGTSSSSPGHDSSGKCLDSSADVVTGSTRIINTKRTGRKSKTYQQNKENVTTKPAARGTRNKKIKELSTISSDGQSNTSSEVETVTCRKRPLRMRNVNLAPMMKPPKGMKASNRYKTRKKNNVMEKCRSSDMDDSIKVTRPTSPSRHHENFSEFEDFSLCIELETIGEKDVVVNAPSDLTPSTGSNSSKCSSLKSLQHSTPNVHTSTPQNTGHKPDKDLFRRLTRSNLRKLATSGLPPNGVVVPHGASLGQTDSLFVMGGVCVENSPAFSHISRRSSLQSELGGVYLNTSQDESAVNVSAGASFLVTMRPRKVITANQNCLFNMSSILSPGSPSPAGHRFKQPLQVTEDSVMEHMDVLQEHSVEVLPEQSIHVLTEKIIGDACEISMHEDNYSTTSGSNRWQITKRLSDMHISKLSNKSQKDQRQNMTHSTHGSCLENGYEVGLLNSAEHCSLAKCKRDSEESIGTERMSSQYSELLKISHAQSDSEEHVDREGWKQMDECGDYLQCNGEAYTPTPCESGTVSNCKKHTQSDHEECESEKRTALRSQSNSRKTNTYQHIHDCKVVLECLSDSFVSRYMHVTPLSSEYDGSRSLFGDTSAHSISNSTFSDYETAEDHSSGHVPVKDTSEVEHPESVEMHSPIRGVFSSRTTSALGCIQEVDMEESFRSLQLLSPMKSRSSGLIITPRAKVLHQCEQEEPISFNDCIPPKMMMKCAKIGEGVYGEVFRSENRKASVALKIIPIEGNFTVNDEPQKTFAEILPEIVISQTLSDLSDGENNMTANYVQVRSCSVVQGSYPTALIKCWDCYHAAKISENDRPDMFPEDQLFIVFEFANSGCDLEGFQFQTLIEAKSVLVQVALSLAVGEASLGFEHRDLHWGNVLVRHMPSTPTLEYTLNDQELCIATGGVQVAVIDFTLSRLQKDGCTVSTDLSKDPTLFEGFGEYQFEVYRLMKEENGNTWDSFHPYTNVLWLHYLADKLLKGKKYAKSTTKAHQSLTRQFRTLIREMLDYGSAVHLVTECSFFTKEYL